MKNQKTNFKSQTSDIRPQTSVVRHPTSDPGGITLIALIITVILLLILTALTIDIAIDGKLFDRAEKTVADSNKKISQVQSDTNTLINEWNTIESGIKGGTSSSETGGSTTEPITDPELDRSNIQVGDYIAYTPDTASAYSLATTVSGYSSAQSISQESLSWRVMSINDDGSVDLVSAAPTTTTVYFQGALGYNNGVYVLNDLCKAQYSNSSLGVTARSLDLVDIENKFNSSGIAARDAYSSYGTTQTYSSSYSYAPDIYTKVGTTAEEESKDYYTSPTNATYEQKGTLTVTQTYYYFSSTTASYFDDSTFRELIFGTGTNYWLASRQALCRSPYAYFGLRIVNSADLGGFFLFYSNNSWSGYCYRVRPVVSLGSNIKISTEGGTADSPREISL